MVWKWELGSWSPEVFLSHTGRTQSFRLGSGGYLKASSGWIALWRKIKVSSPRFGVRHLLRDSEQLFQESSL